MRELMLLGLVVYGFLGWIVLVQYLDFRKSGYSQDADQSFIQTFMSVGLRGEYHIYRALEKLPIQKRLFTNMYLPKEDGTYTEIDLVMLTNKGIFVIESKNYSGWIFGNENQKFWMQTLPAKKNNKHKFLNPIWQNQGHVKAMISSENLDPASVYSLILFSNRCTLKKLDVKKFKGWVIQLNQLQKVVEEANHFPDVFGKNDMIELAVRLRSYCRRSDDFKRKHIESIKKIYL